MTVIDDNYLGPVTIVNLAPFGIREYKASVYPSYYDISAAPQPNGMSMLVIDTDVFSYKYIGDGQDIRMTEKPLKIARSVVGDYLMSKLAYTNEAEKRAWPGLFIVPGKFDRPRHIEEQFAVELKEANEIQRQWFLLLLEMGDDLWAHTRQHRLITSEMKLAVGVLGLRREWCIDLVSIRGTVECPICVSAIPGTAIICPTCRTVLKPEELEKFKAGQQKKVEAVKP